MHGTKDGDDSPSSSFSSNANVVLDRSGANNPQNTLLASDIGVQDAPATNFLYGDAMQVQQGGPLPDMDPSLVWPDSEDLFQSILAADISASWQLPPGTLPLPSSTNMVVGESVAAPMSSNAEQSSILQGLESGDSDRAILGVSEMVSNVSSSLTAAVESTSITSVFLDACLHMFFDLFVPMFRIMHRPTFVY